MDHVAEATLVVGQGIAGSVDRSSRRQVTLLESEAWAQSLAELGVEKDPVLRRANLLLRGVRLAHTRGGVLAIGDTRLAIGGELTPCEWMDEVTPGLQAALRPDWRGGVFAQVVAGGVIRIGDRVEWAMAASRSTRVRQHIRAPRAVVYRLLLDSAAIAKWKVPDDMTARVHAYEAIEGGAIRVSLTYREPTREGKSTAHTDTYAGRFVRLVPDERVVEVNWFETDDPAMRGEMTSTIVLTDGADGGTDVLGIHEGLPPGVAIADNETGWRMALAKLAVLAEADSPKRSS